ncbi:SDR family oxidoreductase [Catellatospora chokoriensis]|uniref:Short-chain dehydrogenase n=1 Tax=Catellatospora chokoriensis TaxID=310353 RepID=A0A8J3JXS4_9ACTN|nr:SDR family oxidoreductase [Catellatospora chokoriensis]GIF90434.1 short-chain dehydrogenase [Catellatospora chokoriensis]
MILRVIVGAAGQLGAAITTASARAGDRTLAVDPLITEAPPGIEVLRAGVGSPSFADALDAALAGATRGELILAGGRVPPLVRVPDATSHHVEAALADIVATFQALSVFAESVKSAAIGGSMLLISTVGARRPHRYMAGYDAARAGMESLARSFALAYAPHGITTRVLAVGPVAESATSRADGDLTDALVRLVPLGRYPRLDEVANAAITVASAALDCANGHTITLDGGLTVQLRPVDIERAPA